MASFFHKKDPKKAISANSEKQIFEIFTSVPNVVAPTLGSLTTVPPCLFFFFQKMFQFFTLWE